MKGRAHGRAIAKKREGEMDIWSWIFEFVTAAVGGLCWPSRQGHVAVKREVKIVKHNFTICRMKLRISGWVPSRDSIASGINLVWCQVQVVGGPGVCVIRLFKALVSAWRGSQMRKSVLLFRMLCWTGPVMVQSSSSEPELGGFGESDQFVCWKQICVVRHRVWGLQYIASSVEGRQCSQFCCCGAFVHRCGAFFHRYGGKLGFTSHKESG